MSDRPVLASNGRHAAQSAEIAYDERGRRRIVIDGELFPFFTQGALETHPGEHGVGTVVMIPLWVDGEVSLIGAPKPVLDLDDDLGSAP